MESQSENINISQQDENSSQSEVSSRSSQSSQSTSSSQEDQDVRNRDASDFIRQRGGADTTGISNDAGVCRRRRRVSTSESESDQAETSTGIKHRRRSRAGRRGGPGGKFSGGFGALLAGLFHTFAAANANYVPGESNGNSTVEDEEGVPEDDGPVEGCADDTIPWNRQKQKVREIFVESFLRKAPRRKIIHDILYNKNNTRSDDYIRRMLESCNGGSVLIAAHHGDHHHVIHDCAYTCSTCRCAAIKELRADGGCIRKSIWSWQFSAEHWMHLSNYLQSEGRYLVYFKIAGRNWLHGK